MRTKKGERGQTRFFEVCITGCPYVPPLFSLSQNLADIRKADPLKVSGKMSALTPLRMTNGLFTFLFLFALNLLAQQPSSVETFLISEDPWKGFSNERIAKLQDAYAHQDILLEWADENPNKKRAGRIYSLFALLAERGDDYLAAREYHKKALTVFGKSESDKFLTYTLFRLGLIQRNYLEDNATAFEYYSRYHYESEKQKDTLNLARSLQNMGNTMRDRDRPKEAEEYFREALRWSNTFTKSPKYRSDSIAKGNFMDRKADIHFDYGKHFEKIGKHMEALTQFTEAVRISKPYARPVYGRSLQRLGAAYYEVKHYPEAIQFSEEAKTIAERDSSWATHAEANYTLYKVYLAQENYAKALENYEYFHVSREASRAIDVFSKLRMRFETEEKEKELALLEQEKNAKQFERNGFGAGIVLLFIIVILIYSRQRLKIQNEGKELAMKSEQLETYMRNLLEKNHLVEKLKKELEELQLHEGLAPKINDLSQILSATILTDQHWEEFKRLFEQVHHGFFATLKIKLPDLSPAETRLMALLKLNLYTKEIAHMLGISPDSVHKSRYRLRKKLDLTPDEELENWAMKL